VTRQICGPLLALPLQPPLTCRERGADVHRTPRPTNGTEHRECDGLNDRLRVYHGV
jgi:hypothetical protein